MFKFFPVGTKVTAFANTEVGVVVGYIGGPDGTAKVAFSNGFVVGYDVYQLNEVAA